MGIFLFDIKHLKKHQSTHFVELNPKTTKRWPKQMLKTNVYIVLKAINSSIICFDWIYDQIINWKHLVKNLKIARNVQTHHLPWISLRTLPLQGGAEAQIPPQGWQKGGAEAQILRAARRKPPAEAETPSVAPLYIADRRVGTFK